MIRRLISILRRSATAGVAATALTAGAGSASTVDQFQEVAGGAVINGSGLAVLSSTGIVLNGAAGLASGGSLPGPVSVAPITLNLVAAGPQIVGGSLFSLTALPAPPAPFLVGSFVDDKADTGALTFLMTTAPSPAAPHFGPNLLVTLLSPFFTPDTIAMLPTIVPPATQSYQVAVRIAQAERVPPPNVIPLPAGAILLGSGLFVLIGATRRRRHRTEI